MSLEAFAYIKDLVATNPLGTDPKSEGDDHLRGVKLTLKQQFSGFTQGKPITVTEDQINYVANLQAALYPVGSIYLSTLATDPATVLGFGTWSRIGEGRCLIDSGATYVNGTTGGEATHALIESELASHSHLGNMSALTGSINTGTFGFGTFASPTGSLATAVTGSGAPHNNMPPYLAICMWKRDA